MCEVFREKELVGVQPGVNEELEIVLQLTS
jgi:hypothetical protein